MLPPPMNRYGYQRSAVPSCAAAGKPTPATPGTLAWICCAKETTSSHVAGGFSGSRPAFRKMSLFQMNVRVSEYAQRP